MPAVEIELKDGTTAYVSFASGAGTEGDPYVVSANATTLTDIKTAVEILDNMISGSEGQVDVVTLPGTSEADITAIKTAVEILDNVVSGSEMQVDVVAALPTGTNDVGNVGTKDLTTVAVGERQGSESAVVLPTVSASLVRVKAVGDNAGNVYLGGTAVTRADGTTDTTTGLELQPGDDTGWIPTDNLNRFYIICDNAGDDITYMVLA